MEDDAKSRILKIIALTLLILASCISAYYSYTNLTTFKVVEERTLGSYLQNGVYEYVANLKPNLFYNTTTLRSGEGKIFTSIVDTLDVNFTYRFIATPKEDKVSIEPSLEFSVESPEKWVKKVDESSTGEFLVVNRGTDFSFRVNVTRLTEYMKTLYEETGIGFQTYALNINPSYLISGELASKPFQDVFTPTLHITYLWGDNNGNYLNFSNMTVTNIKTITDKAIISDQNTFYRGIAFIAATIVLAISSAVVYIKWFKPGKDITGKLDRIIHENEEILVEAKTKPKPYKRVVDVGSINSIIKTSEILLKPVMYWREGDEAFFWVIDDETIYMYNMVKNEEKN